MTHCRHDRFPVPESVFAQYTFLVFRLDDQLHLNAFHLAVLRHQLLALDDVAFFELGLKPLVDLVLCLCCLDNVQPVAAGTLGILRCNNLDPVPVVNHIVDGNQLSVYPGADHLIAHRTVNAVGKVNGIRSTPKRLYVSSRRKTINTVGKQIQITFEQTHKLPVIRHISLPFQYLPKPA